MFEITYEDILLVDSLCLFEGEPFGVVDKNKILSAISNQYQPYPTHELAFSSVYKSLVINHGFVNGNKRTAVIVLYLASKILGNPIILNDEELASLTYKIAGEGGSLIEVEDLRNQIFGGDNKKSSIEIDIEKEAISFINSHKWLMKELGK